MHDSKTHAPVATWPREQFFNLAPILTHVARLCILKFFFVLEQIDIHTWLYVFLTRHITI